MNTTTNNGKCQATTKKGCSCGNKARANSKYCGTHKTYINKEISLFEEDKEEEPSDFRQFMMLYKPNKKHIQIELRENLIILTNHKHIYKYINASTLEGRKEQMLELKSIISNHNDAINRDKSKIKQIDNAECLKLGKTLQYQLKAFDKHIRDATQRVYEIDEKVIFYNAKYNTDKPLYGVVELDEEDGLVITARIINIKSSVEGKVAKILWNSDPTDTKFIIDKCQVIDTDRLTDDAIFRGEFFNCTH